MPNTLSLFTVGKWVGNPSSSMVLICKAEQFLLITLEWRKFHEFKLVARDYIISL